MSIQEIKESVEKIIPDLVNIEGNSSTINRLSNHLNFYDYFPRTHLEELHTHTIRLLLDPQGPHGMGTAFLEEFVKEIKLRFSDLKLEKIADWSSAKIENRDKFADDYGRIDLFLEIPAMNYALVIENKIFAKERPNQLRDYMTYCEKNLYKYDIFFLTPYKRESRDHATFDGYHSISYRNEIRNWLNSCISIDGILPNTMTVLQAYRDIIEKKVLQMHNNEMTEAIAKLLVDEPENHPLIKHLDFIAASQESIRNRLRSKFFLDLGEKLRESSENDYTPHCSLVYNIKDEDIWEDVYRGYILSNKEYSLPWGKDGNVLLQFTIEHDWTSMYYGMTPKSNRNLLSDNFEKKTCFSEIRKQLDHMGNARCIPREDNWILYFLPKIVPGNNFAADNLNFTFASDMEEKKMVTNLVAEINKYLSVWEKYRVVSSTKEVDFE